MAEHLRSKFLTTPWTLILDSGGSQSDRGNSALVKLCENYRYPVFAFIRKQTGDAESARDLSQSFFEFLITKKLHRSADRERGKFRTFLLSAVKNFLLNEHRDSNRQKRAGGKVHIPIDLEHESQEGELNSDSTAEEAFDIKWANTVFDHVWGELEMEFESAGQLERFRALRSCLMMAKDALPYAELAPQLGMTEVAVKSASVRLRHRFRDMFRATVAKLVDNPLEIDGEIAYLTGLMGRE